jgi:hypothetical protein
MDKGWVTAQLEKIFPPELGQERLRLAAWASFVAHTSPTVPNFNLLEAQYRAAVMGLHRPPATPEARRNDGEALAGHLMTMVGSGRLEWGGEDGLLKTFLLKAPTDTVLHFFSIIGQALQREAGTVAPDVINRFVALWERYFAESESPRSPLRTSLKAFGWWFASGCFNTKWACDQLLAVLQRVAEIDGLYFAFEALERVVVDEPSAAIAALRALVKADAEGWSIQGSNDHIQKVLAAGLKGEESRESTIEALNELVARGFTESRGLMTSARPTEAPS